MQQKIPERGILAYPEDGDLAGFLVQVIQSFNLPAWQSGKPGETSYYSICVGLEESLDAILILLRDDDSVSVDLEDRGEWAYRFMREVEAGAVLNDCAGDESAIQMRMLQLLRETAVCLSRVLPENAHCIPFTLAVSSRCTVLAAVARPSAGQVWGGVRGAHYQHYEELIVFEPEGIFIVSIEDEDTFGVIRKEVPWEQIDRLSVDEYGLQLVSDNETSSWMTHSNKYLPEEEIQRLRTLCAQQIVDRVYENEQELIEHQQNLYRNNPGVFDPQVFAQRYGAGALLNFTLSMKCAEEQDEGGFACFVGSTMGFYLQSGQWSDALQIAVLLHDEQQSRVDFERGICYFKLGQLQSALVEIEAAIERDTQRMPDRVCGMSHKRLLQVIILLQLRQKERANYFAQSAVEDCPANGYALYAAALVSDNREHVEGLLEQALRSGADLRLRTAPFNALFLLYELILDVAVEPAYSAFIKIRQRMEQGNLHVELSQAFDNCQPVFKRLIHLGKQKVSPAIKRKRRRFQARSVSVLTQIPCSEWARVIACSESVVLILTNKSNLLCYEAKNKQLYFCWSSMDNLLLKDLSQLLVNGDVLYGFGGEQGLKVFDFDVQSEPHLLCNILPVYSKEYTQITIDGMRMACACNEGVELFDISNARSPQHCGFIATGLFNSPRGIAYAGNILVVSFMALRGLASYNITDPSSPELVDVLRLSSDSDAETQGIVSWDNRIYARFVDGLYCVNVQPEGSLKFDSLLPIQYGNTEFFPAMYFENDLIYCADCAYQRHFSVLDNRQKQIKLLSCGHVKDEEERFSEVSFVGDRLWALSEDRLYEFELSEPVTDGQLLRDSEEGIKSAVYQLIADKYDLDVQDVSLEQRFENLTDSYDSHDLSDIMWDLCDKYPVVWSEDAENLICTVKDLMAWLVEGVKIAESIENCRLAD